QACGVEQRQDRVEPARGDCLTGRIRAASVRVGAERNLGFGGNREVELKDVIGRGQRADEGEALRPVEIGDRLVAADEKAAATDRQTREFGRSAGILDEDVASGEELNPSRLQ